ncbi:MAG: hypothetical protein M3313_09190 [Actinomycetota bacterium]|nr:hypothetical protein [Actinomycetota bacterium]
MAGGASGVNMNGPARPSDAYVRQRTTSRPTWDDPGAGQRGRDQSRPTSGQAEAADRFTLTGLGAVAFIFAVTLALATAESLLGIGLRLITLIALAGSTLLAGLWVRRSDIATIVVAPPLVFAAVAAGKIILAPTLPFTPTVLAAILVRGFPTMAIATTVGLLVCWYRLTRRR